MFARVFKPASRFVSGATLVVAAGTTLALLPATPALAACPATSCVTAANPAVIDNVGKQTVQFTTTDTFNSSLPMTVTITGPAGAGAYDADSNSVSASANSVTASFTFPQSLPAGPGPYTVHICQSIGGACAPNADDSSNGSILTVNAGAHPLAVNSLSNDVRATNADPSTVFSINGNNFAKGDTVSFVPTHNGDTAPALDPTTVTVTNSQITGKFVASGTGSLLNATPGIYDTVVTHTDGTASPVGQADQLAVVNPPTITSVDPAATVGVGAGQNGHDPRAVTLNVTKLPASDPVTLSFPTNATDGLTAAVQSVTAGSDPSVTNVAATISTSASTTAQAVTMTLTDSVSGGSATQSITVDPAPAITSANPSSVGQGAKAVSVTFTGTGLDAKAALSFPASTKVTLGPQALDQTSQAITVPVTVDSAAPTGKVPFSVVNGDAGATDYTGGSSGNSVFSVNAAPVLSSVNPASVVRGSTTTVTLNGSGFTSGMTIAPTNQNSGVQFTSLNVPNGSTTQATVHVTVASDAPTGGIAITLTNPDGGTSDSVGKLSIDSFGVSGISPTTASNGGSGASAVAITITGTSIPTTGTTTLKLTRLPDSSSDTTSVSPITVSPSSTPTSTTWHGTANLVGDAAGTYQVQLVNGSDTGTCSCQFTITSAGAPTISSVSPTAIGQGASTTVIVNGTGFTQGAQISFGKVNNADVITATGPTVFDSTTKVEVPVHVASNAPAASQVDVTVTNPGAAPNSAMKTGAITINAAPAITSFSPTALAQGAATTLTINGTGFDSTSATVTFGAGITQASGATTTTSTQIKIPVKVDQAAPTSVSVTVKNGDGGTGSKTITVNAGPKITSVKPQYVAKDFTGTLTVTGSAFHSGATVSFPTGSAVTTTGTPTVSSDGTTISVPIKVSRTDAAQVDVTVTNNDDLGSGTLPQGLSVAIAPSDPTNATATRNGTSVQVGWTAVPTSANGGAPISGYTVSVTDPANSGLSNQTTTGTSVTFTGLSATASYTFKIVATNAANLSSPGASATTGAQQPGTSLTLISTAGHLVAGNAVTVGGSLSSGSGAPIGGATIVVNGRNDAGQSGVVASTTTGSDGRWIASLRPLHNVTYTASFAGNSQYAAATSTSGRVTVAPKVTISAKPSTAASTKLVVTGSVSPSKAGHTVKLIAVNSHGVKKTFSATLSGSSTYRFKVKLGKGKWTLTVRIGSTSGNAAGRSPKKTIKRT